ncbi:MAG TPA: hypothetical protein VIC56_06255 [Gemmatimonadota bacterium]|jgi:hypothetical protein
MAKPSPGAERPGGSGHSGAGGPAGSGIGAEARPGGSPAENPGTPVEVDQDPIVEAVVGDPCLPPNVWVVRGLPGRSCSDAHLRIYLTTELDEYLEIPRDAVRHAIQCDHECAGLGGVVVWIDRAASVQHVRTREVRAPVGAPPRRETPGTAWIEEGWDDADPERYSKRC